MSGIGTTAGEGAGGSKGAGIGGLAGGLLGGAGEGLGGMGPLAGILGAGSSSAAAAPDAFPGPTGDGFEHGSDIIGR